MDHEEFKEYTKKHFPIAYAAQQITDIRVNKQLECDENKIYRDIIDNIQVVIEVGSDPDGHKTDMMSVYLSDIPLALNIEIAPYYDKYINGTSIEITMMLLVIAVNGKNKRTDFAEV